MKYAEFCRKLLDSGLIEFKADYVEQVGGKQRLVIDARLANLHFGAPAKVHLATGATFSNVEVDMGLPVEVGGVDIADAFYHIELIPELRRYFALPGVRAGDVGCQHVDGQKVGAADKVYPCLKVVPMGWTHALWLCKKAHEFVVNLNPKVDAKLRCVGKKPVPEMKDYIHTQYVDNFVALSQHPGRARELAQEIGASLNKHGLPTHDVEAGVGGETLGWLFSGDHPTVSITPKRLWKMRLATQELLLLGRCNGRTLEKLVGHFTFAGLLQRGFLSTFQATYIFIKKHYEDEVALWPEVARELRWASALLCLVRRDLSSPWITRVHATDASPWGRGVAAAERNLVEVKALGRRSDRWRFTAEEEKQVMQTELMAEADMMDAETLEVKSEWRLGEVGFQDTMEVPLSFIGEDWGKVDGSPWERHEPIPILEGRCIVWLLQHLSRSQKNLHKKHLVLCDSMSVVLALCKGRSSAPAMNRICRQVAALELITGMHVHLRWLPSELNPADLPSRAHPIGDFSLDEGLGKFRAAHAQAEGGGGSKGWRRSAFNFHEEWGRDEMGLWRVRRAQDGGPPPREGTGVGGGQGVNDAAEESSRETGPARQESGGDVPGQEDPAGQTCSRGDQGEELPPCMGQDEVMGGRQPPLPAHHRQVGPCPGQSYQPDVLRRDGSGRCGDPGGCGQVLPGGCDEAHKPAANHRGHERVSEARASSRQAPAPMANAVCDHTGDVGRVASRGFVVADGVGYVWPTRGSHEDAEARPGPAFSTLPALGGDPECLPISGGEAQGRGNRASTDGGRKNHLKGGRVRRGGVDRSAVHEGLWQDRQELCAEAQARCAPVHLRCGRGGEVVEQNPQQAELCGDGDQLHLPASTRKRVHRCAHKPLLDGGAETRKVGLSEVREKVLQRRQSVSGVRQPRRRTEGRSGSSRALDVEDFRRWGQVKTHHTKIGLEIFSGCGHFSRAARRRMKRFGVQRLTLSMAPNLISHFLDISNI